MGYYEKIAHRVRQTGYLLKDNTEAEFGPWHDFMWCDKIVCTISGLPGLDTDSVEFYGSNKTAPLKNDLGFLISGAKPYKKNGEFKISGYRWLRARRVRSTGVPVTIEYYGKG